MPPMYPYPQVTGPVQTRLRVRRYIDLASTKSVRDPIDSASVHRVRTTVVDSPAAATTYWSALRDATREPPGEDHG
jgi:hypothetical protein